MNWGLTGAVMWIDGGAKDAALPRHMRSSATVREGYGPSLAGRVILSLEQTWSH